MRYTVTVQGHTYTVEVEGDRERPRVQVDGRPLDLDCVRLRGRGVYSLLLNGQSFDLKVVRNEDRDLVYAGGQCLEVEVEDARSAALRRALGVALAVQRERELVAPMPGLVVAVKVAPGDEVNTGQGLVIIEAMKMENELFAKFPARVKEVKVKPKEAVERNQPLIIFE